MLPVQASVLGPGNVIAGTLIPGDDGSGRGEGRRRWVQTVPCTQVVSRSSTEQDTVRPLAR